MLRSAVFYMNIGICTACSTVLYHLMISGDLDDKAGKREKEKDKEPLSVTGCDAPSLAVRVDGSPAASLQRSGKRSSCQLGEGSAERAAVRKAGVREPRASHRELALSKREHSSRVDGRCCAFLCFGFVRFGHQALPGTKN